MKRDQRSKLETTSWLAVVRAYQECNRRYAQLLKGFDLTIPQFDVLNAVRQLGLDATPRAIADELVVTRGNITGVLRRLQERALLDTRHHEYDGRSFVCILTSGGERLLGEARLAAARFITAQLEPFASRELQETERQMNRMRLHLQSMNPDEIARALPVRSRTAGQEAANQ